MADHADDNFDGDIFIYRGGRAPQHVTHVLIDKSLDEIDDNAFENCTQLLKVDTHDGLKKIGERAFWMCRSLPRINLKAVVEIGESAFYMCENLESVEFGDRLETIEKDAFACCSLKHLKLRSIITIERAAFFSNVCLTDVELPERLETIGAGAFHFCLRLQRIAIPLKRDLLEYNIYDEEYDQFINCEKLTTVHLVGQAHIKTIASLHMESWRVDMLAEINGINEVLPNTPCIGKAEEIQEWMEMVMDKMDHYKAAHCIYVKEGISLLELALWKAKLCEKEDSFQEKQTKKAKVDGESARKERRVTCGADVVIKNVLPFLQLE